MTQRDLVLAALAPAQGSHHTPVQVQKLLFLLDRNLSPKIDAERFRFAPYNYGPFDHGVYEQLELLEAEGLVVRTPQQSWFTYSLTPAGQAAGEAALSGLGPNAQTYVREVSEFVRKLSFPELVSAIYRAFPDMRVNSVFQE
jgi:uncharacterized protein